MPRKKNPLGDLLKQATRFSKGLGDKSILAGAAKQAKGSQIAYNLSSAPPSVIPRGPHIFQEPAHKDHTPVVTYCQEHPEFQAGGATSLPECYVAWALTKLLGPEGEEGRWSYQQGEQGSRHTPGGSIVDFVIWAFTREIGIRVQGFYFHEEQGSNVTANDLDEYVSLSRQMDVYDIWDTTFVYDDTGQAVILAVNNALNGIPQPNPRANGVLSITGV